MKRSIYTAIMMAITSLIATNAFAGLNISSGTTVTISSGTTVSSDGWSNAGTIANSGTIKNSGDWDNTGTAEVASTVIFDGAAAMNMSGNTVFTDVLEFDAAGTTTLTGGSARVMGTLFLTAGTVNSNGFLYIGSDATATGRIDGSGAGEINGVITCERYVATTNQGWRYFHSPVVGATGADFADDAPLSAGSFGGTVQNGPFPDLVYYDETNSHPNRQRGWLTLASPASTLNLGVGFTLQMPGSGTVDLPGTYDHLDAGRAMALTNSGHGVSSDGWNLIGNSEPSAIDWNLLDKSANVDDAVYIWKASGKYGGSYATYINGFGTNGGSNEIAMMQAFWVTVSTPGIAGITTTNADRVATSPTFLKTGSTETLRMTAEGNGAFDESIIYFEANATDAFDSDFDAHKLQGNSVNLFTYAKEKPMAINAFGELNEDRIIPLHFNATKNDIYSITLDGVNTFDPATNIYLEDLQTGTIQDLRKDDEYTFSSATTDADNRFQIRFSLNKTGIENTVSLDPAVNIFGNNDRVVLDFVNFNSTNATAEVYDMLGQLILSTPGVNTTGRTELNLGTVASASYIVKVVSEEGMFTEQVFLNAK